MTEVENPAETPFKQGQACKACGSTAWAKADLSPIDLRPKTCDRCPPKPKNVTTPRADQQID